MASRAIKTDVKRTLTGDPEPTPEIAKPAAEQSIAVRAYELWHERGCPIGSPEADWFRAEEELRNRPSSVRTTV